MATTNPCQCLCKSIRNPSNLIKKAVELIENPLSSDYLERHVQIIDEFLDACTYAVWLRDIPYIIKLLYSLADKVDSIPEYRRSFIRLLNLCRVPPMLTKMSEIFMFDEDIVEYFAAFGYLLVKLRDDEPFNLILQVVQNLCQETEVGICCINSSTCNNALAISPLPKIISELMYIVDDKLYYKLLETMEHLLNSDETCAKFICDGILNTILTRMCSALNKTNRQVCNDVGKINASLKYFDLNIRILWKLLGVFQKYSNISTDQLLTPEAWQNVQHVLKTLSMLNMKKHKRNSLVTVILYLLKVTKLNVTCALADDLSLLCALPEVRAENTWTSKVELTNDIIDYHFKKQLFLIITYYPRDPDLTKVNSFPIQVMALNLLVDLCEEGSCIPFLLTWRGKNKTAIEVFLEIFRNENKKIGVNTTSKGHISDVELPLMGRKQFEMTFRHKKNGNSSPAAIDMLGSCRPKIYALLHILYCNKAGVVEAVNEHYKISSFPLSVTDQITKLLAENYLPLKLGEVWVELKRDLEVAGIRPLAYDQEVVSTMVRRFYMWSMHIKKEQEKLSEKEHKQDIMEEQVFYNRLKQTRLSESLDALDDLRHIARCTENVFRLMSKMRQNDQLRQNLDYDPEFYIKFHSTFLRSVAVTPVFNQKVSIRSNIIVEPSHQIISVEPVSPSNSITGIKVQENNCDAKSEQDMCELCNKKAFVANIKDIKKLT